MMLDSISVTQEGPLTIETLLAFLGDLHRDWGRDPFWIDMNVNDGHAFGKTLTPRQPWLIQLRNPHTGTLIHVTFPENLKAGTLVALTLDTTTEKTHADYLYYRPLQEEAHA